MEAETPELLGDKERRQRAKMRVKHQRQPHPGMPVIKSLKQYLLSRFHVSTVSLMKNSAQYDAINPYYLHLHNQKLPITQKKGEPHKTH